MLNIFWGTGNSGRINLALWQSVGKRPDFFCCNDSQLWGKKFENIEVISPDELQSYITNDNVVYVYITSQYINEISSQLILFGLNKKNIIVSNSPYYSSHKDIYDSFLKEKRCESVNNEKRDGFIFELTYGTSLGGTQSWLYSVQKHLRALNYEGVTITANGLPKNQSLLEYQLVTLERFFSKDLFHETLKYLLLSEFNTYIAMDTTEYFVAACAAKRILSDNFCNIIVVHSDFYTYYEACMYFKDDIDFCLVISKKIKEKLESLGFPSNKIRMLYWNIDFDFKQNKVFNLDKKINITYLGRIEKTQKRCDLLIDLLLQLKKSNVDFSFTFIGIGGYESFIKSQVIDYGLQNLVLFKGSVDRSDLQKILLEQDIYVSCSEFEGHSVAQCEAMACGCVPVVFDVSGAEDDVFNGFNGYVIEIGDLDSMVDAIKFLNSNRDILKCYGKRCIEIIQDRNKKENTLVTVQKEFMERYQIKQA